MPRKINWKNPQALIYENNYGYGMNYYQPMIDYIETKDRGAGRTKYPHLPWTNERGLTEYSPRKIVRCYSAEDLSRISRQTEARIKTKLKDFKATTKSKFQLEATVSAATITKKVHTEEKKAKNIIKQIDRIKHKMADDVIYEPEVGTLIEEGLKSAKKYLQGKSAKAIEGQLLAEARKHIAEGIVGEIDIKKYQRNAFINTYDTRVHTRMMCERMQKQLDESFMKPLDDLSVELKGFDKKTSEYFLDKR